MTIRHYRIFASVCENGCSMTRAAEALHMTQPAVSQAISELENNCGVKLFERQSKRLSLSSAGKKYLEGAKAVLLAYDDTEKSISCWDMAGEIRIGSSISIGSCLLPSFVRQFSEIHKETKVYVSINRSEQLERDIIDNKIDFALIEGYVHDPMLIYEDFCEDRLALISSGKKHKNGTVVPARDFLGMDFLLRENGSGTREVFESCLTAAGYPLPEPVWVSLSTAALLNAAAEGLGIAVVPWRMAREKIESGQVSEIFAEGLEFIRKYKIVKHRDKVFTRAAQDFLEICRRTE